jgi:hypothetical protein
LGIAYLPFDDFVEWWDGYLLDKEIQAATSPSISYLIFFFFFEQARCMAVERVLSFLPSNFQ